MEAHMLAAAESDEVSARWIPDEKKGSMNATSRHAIIVVIGNRI
jgi:hypothetical protein